MSDSDPPPDSDAEGDRMTVPMDPNARPDAPAKAPDSSKDPPKPES